MQLFLDGLVVLTVFILAIAYLGQKKGNRKARPRSQRIERSFPLDGTQSEEPTSTTNKFR